MITIVANGKERRVPASSTVEDLLRSLELHPRTVAVEHNRRILERADYETTVLADGDQLEIVRFVQGG